MDDRPTFGSLFAGIGGIDLGLERAGWECRFQVEWDPFCQRVLAKHWPDVPRYGDITAVDWSGVDRVDLLAGGFPCQPFSYAGRRGGMDDDRWLWPEFARAIRALRPRFVLVENVPGLLVGGGMDAVLGGLAELGYDTEWESIPAAAVGAPHLRYRVWIIAYRQGDASRPDANGAGLHRTAEHERDAEPRYEQSGVVGSLGWPLAYAHSPGSQGRQVQPERADQWTVGACGMADPESPERGATELQRVAARERTPEPGERGRLGGSIGDWWSVEPDVGRVAHGVPARVDRLRSLGNAVVPQVVEYIGRRLIEAEALT